MIYFDNNATTLMTLDAKKSLLDWCNRGNPSASYASARMSRAMMEDFRAYIGKLCNIDTCCPEPRDAQSSGQCDPNKYKIIFTSGASESNCTIIRGVIDAYIDCARAAITPHVIITAIEHKSIMDMVQSLVSRRKITASYITPTASGHIRPNDVAAAITQNTCLICVMHANNETGAINDIAAIGAIAHKSNIVFHCDTVQTFGKFPINPVRSNVDSFCVSFHKLYGPMGVGALIIKQQLLLGYKLQPTIFGTQNEGLRGGSENLAGIGAAFTAMRGAMVDRRKKNDKMLAIKKHIMEQISKALPAQMYVQYLRAGGARGNKNAKLHPVEIVFLSGNTEFYLCNTLLLSIVKRGKPSICNSQIKKDLEDRGIVISVGSACNTANSKASHVLFALRADELVRKGAIRISLCDDNTMAEANKFIAEFLAVIKIQL